MIKVNQDSLQTVVDNMRNFQHKGFNKILYNHSTGEFKLIICYGEEIPHEWPETNRPWEVVEMCKTKLSHSQVIEALKRNSVFINQ